MTIEEESKRIRRAIPRMTPGQKRRFKPALRARILDWIDRAKASGLREADCSRLIGLPAPQFNAWRARHDQLAFELPLELKIERVDRDLVPIEVPPGIELTVGVVFVSPSGCRVEGLNLGQAYALLREYQ
jgi:hypothetical protein